MRLAERHAALYADNVSDTTKARRQLWTNLSIGAIVVGSGSATVFGRGFGDGFLSRPFVLGMLGFAALCVALPWGLVSRKVVLRVALALLIVGVVFPPRGSRDVYSYASYGRMVSEYQISPYTHSPFDLPADTWSRHVSPRWVDTQSVYGPIFTAISAAGMWVAGDSILVGRLFFQGLAAAALIGIIVALDRRTRGDPIVLALVALNPVIMTVTLNGGHNDMLIGLALLLAVFATLDRKMNRAALLLGVAIGIKATAGLGLIAIAVWLLTKHGYRAAVHLCVVAGAVSGTAYLLAGGMTAVKPLLEAGRYNMSNSSMWSLLTRFVSGEWASDDTSRAAARELAGGIASRSASLTLVCLALAVVLARRNFASPALPVGAAVLAFCFTTPWLLPWYLAPAIPLLAMHWRSRLSQVGLVYAIYFTIAYARGYAPHGITKAILGGVYWTLPFFNAAMLLGLLTLAVCRLTGRWPRFLAPAGLNAVDDNPELTPSEISDESSELTDEISHTDAPLAQDNPARGR
jgi:hypothetical protein